VTVRKRDYAHALEERILDQADDLLSLCAERLALRQDSPARDDVRHLQLNLKIHRDLLTDSVDTRDVRELKRALREGDTALALKLIGLTVQPAPAD
jgi:hypothetical protein